MDLMDGVERKATTMFIITMLFVSCFSTMPHKNAHFVNLVTQEQPSETTLIFTTSEPVPFKDTKLENPPCILISFPDKKVFSSEEDVVIVNKGPIKRIRNEYYQSGNESERQLNLVIVELTQDVDYQSEL